MELDLNLLRAEHVHRSHWLAARLAAPRQVDWDRGSSGIAEISSWPLWETGTESGLGHGRAGPPAAKRMA
jgi:hypothetical protein